MEAIELDNFGWFVMNVHSLHFRAIISLLGIPTRSAVLNQARIPRLNCGLRKKKAALVQVLLLLLLIYC